MRFLDINSFYASRAGGIRSYHQAKINYFREHPQDEYFLVYPGPRHQIVQIAENVRLVEIFGFKVSRDPEGYRLIFNYPLVYKIIRKAKPHVIEVGDYWLTGVLCLFAPFLGKALRASFYHADLIDTYLSPWAAINGNFLKQKIKHSAERLYFHLQRKYDATLVSSKWIEAKLNEKGIPRVFCVPFGLEQVLLKNFFESEKNEKKDGQIRLLYLGRLEREKGIDLVLQIIPRLLEDPRLHVTVAGRGKYHQAFERMTHPRFRFMGYLKSRQEVAETYRKHHIFLAPGPYETFGLSVLEAMASGLVVVGANRGGVAELLKGLGSPFVFESGQAEAFYHCVMSAVNSDLALEARKSYDYARNFGTWEEAIKRMIALYKRIVKERDESGSIKG